MSKSSQYDPLPKFWPNMRGFFVFFTKGFFVSQRSFQHALINEMKKRQFIGDCDENFTIWSSCSNWTFSIHSEISNRKKKKKKKEVSMRKNHGKFSSQYIKHQMHIFFFFRRALWVRPKAFQHPPHLISMHTNTHFKYFAKTDEN